MLHELSAFDSNSLERFLLVERSPFLEDALQAAPAERQQRINRGKPLRVQRGHHDAHQPDRHKPDHQPHVVRELLAGIRRKQHERFVLRLERLGGRNAQRVEKGPDSRGEGENGGETPDVLDENDEADGENEVTRGGLPGISGVERVEEEEHEEAEGEEGGPRQDAEEDQEHAGEIQNLLRRNHLVEHGNAQTRLQFARFLVGIQLSEKRLMHTLLMKPPKRGNGDPGGVGSDENGGNLRGGLIQHAESVQIEEIAFQ